MPCSEQSTQAGVFSLCQPASRNCQPTKTLTTNQNQLTRILWNKSRAIGEPGSEVGRASVDLGATARRRTASRPGQRVGWAFRRGMRNPGRDQQIRSVVVAHIPDYQIDSVLQLGEGMDNIAYVVNDELIVRFSKGSDRKQRALRVHREASVLAIVAAVSPLPVPLPTFTVAKQGCLAYFKIPGVPLLDLSPQQRSAHAASIAATLGEFLSAIHAVPVDRLAELMDTDDDRPVEWRRDAVDAYAKIAAQVPLRYRRAVEAFLDASPPDDEYALAFSHNDLGIEHVLVDPGTATVTGIIDWSDAAIADPAYDFGLLYRDLGPLALDAAIGGYRTDLKGVESLRDRAEFYARCSVFEDLAFGIGRRQDTFIDHSIAALEWLFPA